MTDEELDKRVQRAVDYFMAGYGCCQSVVAAFSDLYGLDETMAKRIAAGFGGGVGRLRMMCGAVSGIVMLVGLDCGQTEGSDREGKSACYKVVQDLLAQSKEENGSLICAEILGLKGYQKANNSYVASARTAEYYKTRPCAAKVESAARIFANYLKNKELANPPAVEKKEGSYALFFDIDGTLVSFNTHEIPASTILALTQAKANGHRVYIATGRPPIIITNLGAIEHLIDGFVTINGALCFVGDKVVSCNAIPDEAARLVIADAQERQYSLIVIGERDIAVFDPNDDVDRIFRQQLAVQNLHLSIPVEEMLNQRILQLTAFFGNDYEESLMARIPSCISGRWHPEFTDITARTADKGQGLLTLAAHEGIDPAHTIAFGDGGNDTSMIRTAAIGIAMGNAIDSLKADANYVTTTVDDNGVLNALRHFGIV